MTAVRVKACPSGDQIVRSTTDKGRKAEQRAVDYLTRRGYRILDRNVRFKEGELDIVAIHEGCLCFVEVRSRSSFFFGTPEETISKKKQHRLLAAAKRYLQKHPRYMDMPARFDVVSVGTGLLSQVRLIQDAFGSNDTW